MSQQNNVHFVYIVQTDMGEFLYDQDLNFLTEDNYEPIAMFSFQQEVLAPAEDWENWEREYPNEWIVDQIRMLIRAKMKRIAKSLEVH